MTVENKTEVVENNLLAGLKDIDPESELNNASIAVEMAIEADDFKKKYLNSMKTSKKEVDDVLGEVEELKDLENELEEGYTNPRYREELKQTYETLSGHSSKMGTIIDLYDDELAKIESGVVKKNSLDTKGAKANKDIFEKYAEEAKAIKEKLPELREKIENLKRDQEMKKAIDNVNKQNQRLQEENEELRKQNEGLRREKGAREIPAGLTPVGLTPAEDSVLESGSNPNALEDSGHQGAAGDVVEASNRPYY